MEARKKRQRSSCPVQSPANHRVEATLKWSALEQPKKAQTSIQQHARRTSPLWHLASNNSGLLPAFLCTFLSQSSQCQVKQQRNYGRQDCQDDHPDHSRSTLFLHSGHTTVLRETGISLATSEPWSVSRLLPSAPSPSPCLGRSTVETFSKKLPIADQGASTRQSPSTLILFVIQRGRSVRKRIQRM